MNQDLEVLMKGDPEGILSALDGEPVGDYLLTVAEISSRKAKKFIESNQFLMVEGWIRVSIQAYKLLAAHAMSETSRLSYELEMIKEMIFLLRSIGESATSQESTIFEWFNNVTAYANVNIQDVEKDSFNWTMELPEKLIVYRYIKNVLTIMSTLPTAYVDEEYAKEFLRWNLVKGKLP